MHFFEETVMPSKIVMAAALFLIVIFDVDSALPQTRVQPGELFMVKKGVFTLKVGQSIDLTDRGILLNLQNLRRGPDDKVDRVTFTLNGRFIRDARPGHRTNLKERSETRDFLKDIRACFLDLVSAVAPRGASARATFRLLCD